MSAVLKGSIVALVTPFFDGKVDFESFGRLVDYHLENKTDALLVCGTTGEAATLTDEEYGEVLRFVSGRASGIVPVIAGTGLNDTEKTVERTRLAAEEGYDYALVVTPYYNKPTQNGLVAHYSHVAENSDIPVILYNVPSRTGINLLPSTVSELAVLPGIYGIKEASGSVGQGAEILASVKNFPLFSGDDKINLPLVAIGGSGSISVVSNIIPMEFSRMFSLWWEGDHDRSLELYYKYLRLCDLLFIETNPVPAKAALEMMNLIRSSEVRLPLVKMKDSSIAILKEELGRLEII
ncbi:MAG: 4-hydroxy-tetrahydrodipicolinate synthase [Deltaproteobacteria bacterium]|nr:4-hydroxy-tetrahydrodipicolinate synthase [Deltaproteobacteria bacterium]